MVGACGCEQPFALRAPVHPLLSILVYCKETLSAAGSAVIIIAFHTANHVMHVCA